MEISMAKALNKIESKTALQNVRFERKFIFQNIALEDLIAISVFTNSFCFKEIFTERSVNNMYLDDTNFSMYHLNVSGNGLREKYRLRWYGENFSEINDPTLEIKRKFGDAGDKISFKLNGFKTDVKGSSADAFLKNVLGEVKSTQNKQLLSKLHLLAPALYNSYDRRYFLSHCERYRITLDYNMKFFNPNLTNYGITERTIDDIVLELKYDTKHDNESRLLSQEIDSRLSKNSKYVRGLEIINS